MFKINHVDVKVIPRAFISGDRSIEAKKIYGILIEDKDSGLEFRPHYPYAQSKEDLPVLQEFLDDYKDDLIDYNVYSRGQYPTFANYLYGFDTDVQMRFR